MVRLTTTTVLLTVVASAQFLVSAAPRAQPCSPNDISCGPSPYPRPSGRVGQRAVQNIVRARQASVARDASPDSGNHRRSPHPKPHPHPHGGSLPSPQPHPLPSPHYGIHNYARDHQPSPHPHPSGQYYARDGVPEHQPSPVPHPHPSPRHESRDYSGDDVVRARQASAKRQPKDDRAYKRLPSPSPLRYARDSIPDHKPSPHPHPHPSPHYGLNYVRNHKPSPSPQHYARNGVPEHKPSPRPSPRYPRADNDWKPNHKPSARPQAPHHNPTPSHSQWPRGDGEWKPVPQPSPSYRQQWDGESDHKLEDRDFSTRCRHLGHKQCPTYSNTRYGPVISGFECADVRTGLETCGGCVDISLDGERSDDGGRDCSAIPHVDGVHCSKGQCIITKCRVGYVLSEDGENCVNPRSSGTFTNDLLKNFGFNV